MRLQTRATPARKDNTFPWCLVHEYHQRRSLLQWRGRTGCCQRVRVSTDRCACGGCRCPGPPPFPTTSGQGDLHWTEKPEREQETPAARQLDKPTKGRSIPPTLQSPALRLRSHLGCHRMHRVIMILVPVKYNIYFR